ncbi:MAG: FAD-dependent oxidoreductase [Lentimicrobiaceae bacterium]|jgi:glycine/D-amino acid oxidase-like deaminating enzyme/NADPH-dependent 2,4-dienoyl-CoA reductase/sulfur reductase-like enzyme/Fe-S-cluster-containing hydrogenase component 2|nr:FAD-dependent oxidoreductase [Lentimicrobiaceae bacterium]
MYKIVTHPILDIPKEDLIEFLFEGKPVKGQRGHTIAAALHQAGFQVHKHSLKNRNRTMECGIGKCGACEMLVNGQVRRICITNVEEAKTVERIGSANTNDEKGSTENLLNVHVSISHDKKKVYKTTVAIIGAGPAGLAVREMLNKFSIDNLVIDNNTHIGGQFLMQTHQFFFFEKEKRFGGMRGFDIAKTLAGESLDNILLDSVVWDILQDKRLAVKNIKTQEVFYVDADQIVVATGAVPFMPAFKNDDVPGVYTAAVVQRMMNSEFTLLGKNILTVGAGNIGYLTSYQAMQAGAHVKAIIEAMPHEGGFPVQANRVRRLGIPIMTSHVLLEAIPNDDYTGVVGAIIAKAENFKPIPGTEQRIDGIDCINICTGLIPDDQLFKKGIEVFGRNCYSVGDATRIGEGTSAVLRGQQCAYEIAQSLGKRFHYDDYLVVSKEYIDSQQHPKRILEKPNQPDSNRMNEKGFVVLDCLYGFACNPCAFACKYQAITKNSTSVTPSINYDKCIGCMDCVYQCPGLAIFGYQLKKNQLFLPIEYEANEGADVFLIDNNGEKVGEGTISRIMKKSNKTNVAVVTAKDISGDELLKARGFIVKENYPEPLLLKPVTEKIEAKTFICHCEDVTIEELLKSIGDRKTITAAELKHISRIGMGDCRGTRCLPRARQLLRTYGIEVYDEFTPRAPMANQVNLGNIVNIEGKTTLITPAKSTQKAKQKVGVIIAGGGMAGSALFRYLSEAGYKPLLINKGAGSTWRCIAGGRPAFSLPALADIANHNLDIFQDLQREENIDFKRTRYVNLAHDEATYKSLEASMAWSDAYLVDKKDFQKEISKYFNPNLETYSHALITNNCWQSSPGKTIDLVRRIGIRNGGIVYENTELVDVVKLSNGYKVVVRMSDGNYVEYETDLFINALGGQADTFAKRLGIETGMFPVRHQAFITKRLPMLGKDGNQLDMLIDRRKHKGFSAVYGQQLSETGQIIACASPAIDALDTNRNLKINTQDFLEIVSEVFTDWIPQLAGVGFQAVWSGYYVEPRYIVDPEKGLFVGMRGHGFMLSNYIAKLYVDSMQGKPIPDYFNKLRLEGEGLSEAAFK